MRDNLNEDEQSAYLDEDDSTKLDKKSIKKDAKSKGDEIEADTKAKLKFIASLWDEQSKLNKEIKLAKLELIQLTKEAIEHLSDEDVEKFLHIKWINPICEGVEDVLTESIEGMKKKISFLASKYSTSFKDIETSLNDVQKSLSTLVMNLTGDEFTLQGLNELIKVKED